MLARVDSDLQTAPTTTIASTRLAPMWPVVIIVVILVPLLVLAWIRVRQR